MKIVYVSNYLNHHQANLADELYRITGGEYRFVAEKPFPQERKALGYASFDDRPYLIDISKSQHELQRAEQAIMNAEVVIFGLCRTLRHLEAKRLRDGKITLESGERFLKHGLLNIASPYVSKWLINYHIRCKKKPEAFLSMSAYGAHDMRLMGAFRNRCYRWGYFPISKKHLHAPGLFESFKDKTSLKILYIGRFLDWKRIDIAIRGVKHLKDKGINCKFNIYGAGSEESKLRQLIDTLNLNDIITIHNAVAASRVPETMRHHHCMVFCSNRLEGWGAVVNEAMASGCTVIGNNEAGSIPFLIHNKHNGLIFNHSNQAEFNTCLEKLATDISFCEYLARNAHAFVANEWSVENAAKNLLQLIAHIKENTEPIPESGPCSKMQ